MGLLDKKDLDGWTLRYQWFIMGKATERWTPYQFCLADGNKEDGPKKWLGQLLKNAIELLRVMPSGRELEIVCGLSHGRTI